MPGAAKPQLQLAIDTSSPLTSICISRDDEIASAIAVRMSHRRSERLWSQIDFLLKEADLSVDSIDLFSVCTGPGGFTGIRVGMAAAKGLAMAARRPLIGVSSLEAVAAAASSAGARTAHASSGGARTHASSAQAVPARAILAMNPAHQDEVFWQLFQSDDSGAPIPETDPAVSPPDQALERAAGFGRLVIIGDGARDHADVIERYVTSRSGRRRRDWVLERAPAMLAPVIARVALIKAVALGNITDAGDVKACYVRPAQAETKLALGLIGPGLRPT